VNFTRRSDIDWVARQAWLHRTIEETRKARTGHKNWSEYDCAVAVSGGKDSTAQVRFLFEKYKIKKALLIHVPKIFTLTQVGRDNLQNLCDRFPVDLITVRLDINRVKAAVRRDFLDYLNPGKSTGASVYEIPKIVCQRLGISLLFYGENGEYEYGGSKNLDLFANNPDQDGVSCVYLGAIEPYSGHGWYEFARGVGFKDLSDTKEWYRQGTAESFSEIDSFGHTVAIWTKFVKYGFQRVSDITSRMVRENRLSRDQALEMTRDHDWICDPKAKDDFCEVLGISHGLFEATVDHHANANLVKKDLLGNWRRIDLVP
jgi:hypothetical protein